MVVDLDHRCTEEGAWGRGGRTAGPVLQVLKVLISPNIGEHLARAGGGQERRSARELPHPG